MDNSLIIASIGLASGGLGGAINWLLVRRRETENLHRALRQEIYGDFVDAMWSAALADESDRKSALEIYATLANKIAIYGSDDVINKLAPVMRTSVVNEKTKLLWIDLIITMRKDIGLSRGDTTGASVGVIMFERDVPQTPAQVEPNQG
jgi:hypothetical protein